MREEGGMWGGGGCNRERELGLRTDEREELVESLFAASS